MLRSAALILSAATLCACATATASNKMASNPNATTIEVVAPEPVLAKETAAAKMATKMAGGKTDVMGHTLMTTQEADMMEDKAAAMIAQENALPKEEEMASPKLENLYYTAQTKWEMMSFVEAVNAADLAAALEADGAMTVFAPTSDAFAQAGDAVATAYLLKGHIVSGKFTAEDLMARAAKGENSLPTLAGTNLTLYVMGESVKVADASGRLFTVTQADAEASNGVLHMINGVLSGK